MSRADHMRMAMVMLAAVALSGCASMSESECKVADWQRIGERDGEQGRSESRLAEHAEACGKIGIQPDAARYRRGWDLGVMRYCTPEVGWREGLNGSSYQGVCRGRNEGEFLRFHRAGLEVHRVEKDIEANHAESRRLEDQLKKARTDDERKRLRDRLRSLDREQSHLRQRAAQLRSYGP